MPPLYARPRHAAPRDHSKVRAALVPAVLLASTGSALGGLAVSAAADDSAALLASSQVQLVDPALALAEREAVVESLTARASRDRARADLQRAEAARIAEEARLAAEAEAARIAEEARLAAEAEAARIAEEARVAAEVAAEAAAAAAAAPRYARPGVGRLTSGFGHRWGRLHAGIDLAAGTGSPIRAAAAGTVVSARNEGGYGKCIRIEHADGAVTVYAHLSAFQVDAGQKVVPGQQIGREGNTGQSTGPHLHFEVRYGGEPTNPAAWLEKRGISVR